MPSVPSPADLPLPVNLGLFAAAAALVWFAGVRLARIGDVLADRTGLGRALFGILFLALATSLPEVATTATASLSGNASLATNNLLGGIVLQTGILVVGDASFRSGTLTFFSPKPVLLLQGTLLIMLLGLVLSVIIVGELITIGWVGLGSVIVLAAYAGSLYLMRTHDPSARWQPVDVPDTQGTDEAEERLTAPYRKQGTLPLFGWFALGAAGILVAGFVLATVADALAQQTGLGSSFVGATLLAASTSLPEVSTTIAAVQIGAYSLAVSNILGSNALMVGLIFLADVTFTGGPILDELDQSAVFGAAAGVVATAIYLVGLIERRNRQIWRLGMDSVAMIAFYALNLGVLWMLR